MGLELVTFDSESQSLTTRPQRLHYSCQIFAEYISLDRFPCDFRSTPQGRRSAVRYALRLTAPWIGNSDVNSKLLQIKNIPTQKRKFTCRAQDSNLGPLSLEVKDLSIGLPELHTCPLSRKYKCIRFRERSIQRMSRNRLWHLPELGALFFYAAGHKGWISEFIHLDLS